SYRTPPCFVPLLPSTRLFRSRESESIQTLWPRPESLCRLDSDMLFCPFQNGGRAGDHVVDAVSELLHDGAARRRGAEAIERERVDRKSTRLNSSHPITSYAVC